MLLMFLDMALNQALFGDILGSSGKKGGGILGFLTGGKLAKGGRAAGGKSFLVGEKGPELPLFLGLLEQLCQIINLQVAVLTMLLLM